KEVSTPSGTRLSRRAALLAMLGVAMQVGVVRDSRAAEPTPVERANAAPVAWESLTSEERKLLARHAERWSSLTPEQQQRLVRGARRWANMTPEQRERAQARFARWKELTPEQRERARRAWRRYQEL